jgi:hypothetical protein
VTDPRIDASEQGMVDRSGFGACGDEHRGVLPDCG